MLSTLRIRNLALVPDITLELQPGFNAITGETGAGKSILIGALNLLLGQRADRSLIRAGADSCSVEASIDLGKGIDAVTDFLARHDMDPAVDGQLLLKRAFTAAGANRQFINGSPASLQMLAELGEALVDIHGPHDHQSLFHPARQLELLDAYAGLRDARDAFARAYDERARLQAEKAALIIDEASYARRVDLLRHQVQEIEAARLQPEDGDALEAEHARALNSARLLELSQAALNILSGEEDSLASRTAPLGRALQDLARIDPEAAPLEQHLLLATDALRELQTALSSYADRIDLDATRLQELEDRLNLVQNLRRKYGGSIEAILAFGENARAELDQLERRDIEVARINEAISKIDSALRRDGKTLTDARKRAIPDLARAVDAQLRDLGFRQSEFKVRLSSASEPQRSGFDTVEFQFAPNPGEPVRALRAIASSGELARVMLALKTVLAAQDDIPIVVFDEVDANVGGETAHAVGAKMREIGRRRQVLCITHLAPVAAAGDAHFKVAKSTRDGRTVSEIALLSDGDRVAELARMLGGGDAAQRHAKALLTARESSPPNRRHASRSGRRV